MVLGGGISPPACYPLEKMEEEKKEGGREKKKDKKKTPHKYLYL
jgi:hypothetical protein